MKLRTMFTAIAISAATMGVAALTGCGSTTSAGTSNTSGTTATTTTAATPVKYFTNTSSAANQLTASNTLFVDVRSFALYSTGHIPGAVRNTVSLNSATITATGKAGSYGLTQAEFINLANTLGITPSTQVIAYDTDNSSSVGRFVWTLLHYGHTNVAILDGGYPKWVSEKRATLTKSNSTTPTPNATSYVVPSTIPNIEIFPAAVEAAIDESGSVIWDSRTGLEYIGENLMTNPRGGHIPSAVNLNWADLQVQNSNGVYVLKSSTELLSLLQQYGITPDKQIIVHCQSGVRAGYATVVLLGLGYPNVQDYTGSFGEWSAATYPSGTTTPTDLVNGTNPTTGLYYMYPVYNSLLVGN
jgi:thiosulfate/3-mercaptopyruvate sulfurtransferase